MTAVITFKNGKTVTLCDPWEEIEANMLAGKSFNANEVVGMKPNPVVINPVHVALTQKSS